MRSRSRSYEREPKTKISQDKIGRMEDKLSNLNSLLSDSVKTPSYIGKFIESIHKVLHNPLLHCMIIPFKSHIHSYIRPIRTLNMFFTYEKSYISTKIGIPPIATQVHLWDQMKDAYL